MKELTNIEERHLQAMINQQIILQITKLSEQQYQEQIYESGLKFLQHLFPDNTDFEKERPFHESSKIFWSWFQVQWQCRERDFIRGTQHVNHPDVDWLELWQEVFLDTVENGERTQLAFANYIEALKKYQQHA